MENQERIELRAAIEPWWSGGGTAVLLVDVLLRLKANVSEARRVAEVCGGIADKGYRITEQLIEREVGDLRSSNLRIGEKKDDERVIGSPAWQRRAARMHQRSWEHYFPGEPMPPANPGEQYSDAQDDRYAALIRSQREQIAKTVGKGRREERERGR